MARTRSNVPATVAEAPTMDLSALASSVKTSTPTTGGGRFANNPLVPIVRESFKLNDEGENGWRENTVPGFHVRDFAAAIRHAATVLADEGIGVRIRYNYTDDQKVTVEHGNVKDVPEDGRDVTVKFLGRPRKVYGADEDNGETGETNGDDYGDDYAEDYADDENGE